MSSILARRGRPALPQLFIPQINVVNRREMPDGLRSPILRQQNEYTWDVISTIQTSTSVQRSTKKKY